MNNNAPDPKNISSVSSENGPQSGPVSPTPSTDGGAQARRRLLPDTELSDGRYRIERLIAAGGMGAVYRAIDKRFNRPCAVKEMLDDFTAEAERAQSVEWFRREATLLLDLSHQCIPRVRDFFTQDGRYYLVMDFIEGRTLSEILEKEGTVIGVNGARGVPEARARSWAIQLCDVLGYLHRQNPPIIFRDLKPSNIMVTGQDEIKLIDFGIARSFQSQGQATIIMTVGYAPPEQLHGMPEPRSDIYSLGATLHRVLTCHDAANNKPTIFSFPPVRSLRPDLSVGFEQILMKALAYTPNQRWQSCDEMARALRNLPPVTATPVVSAPLGSGQHFAGRQTPSGPQNPPSGGSGGYVPSSGPVTTGTTGPGGQFITAALGHMAAGRIEEAYMATRQACGIEPNNALVHKLFGQVFARRRPPQVDQAIRAYAHSIELDPNDAETHKLMGDIWLYLRPQPYQAIPHYTRSVSLNPRDHETHFRLGLCYEKTNQLEPALKAYQEALNLVPKQPPQMMGHYGQMLGRLAMRMQRYPVAEHGFVQALIANPADHNTRFLLSQVYEAEQKLEDAFRECSYVLGPLGSMNPAVAQMYQRLRARLGR